MVKKVTVVFVESVIIVYALILCLLVFTGGFDVELGALTVTVHGFTNPLSMLIGALLVRRCAAGSFFQEWLVLSYFQCVADRVARQTVASRPFRTAVLIALGVLVVITVLTWAFQPMQPGLTGAYYQNAEWRDAPLVTVREHTFDLGRMTREFPATTTDYSIQWTGVLSIAAAGDYEFATISDDGSELWLDDRLVVDNRGRHGVQRQQGQIALTPGFHAIRIRYMQGDGGATLSVAWKSPGRAYRELSHAPLFASHPAHAISFGLFQVRQIVLPLLLVLWCLCLFLVGLSVFSRLDKNMPRAVRDLGFLVVVMLVFVLHAVYLGAVAEDAFISFRFAKNLAFGNGLVWNVGEAPVEGYTNFLWVVISAAALRAGLNVAPFMQSMGVAASLASLWYSYLFCRRLIGLGPRLSLAPCAYLALAGPFATWAASGMETNLFAMLVLSSTYHIVSYWRRRKVAALGLGFFLATLATLTRPEGFGVFCILMGMHGLRAILDDGAWEFTKAISAAAVFYLLPFGIYFMWRFGYYGYLLPNTFYAKTGGTVYQWYRGATYLLFFGFHYVCPVLPLLTASVLTWASDEKTARRTTLMTKVKGWVSEYYGAVVCLSLCLCYSGYILLVGGDYMAMYRFLVPILPLAYILLAHAASVLYAGAGASARMSALATALLILGMLGTFVHSTPLEFDLFAKPSITHGQYRGVLKERWHSRRLSVIGRFFNDYKRDEGETLATNTIGAVSYYSNLRTYDFFGLLDPYIAHQQREDLGKGFAGHEKSDVPYILAKRPTYIMFTFQLLKTPCSFPGGYPPDVTAHYRLVAKWLDDKANGESGYFCFLQRKPDAKPATEEKLTPVPSLSANKERG